MRNKIILYACILVTMIGVKFNSYAASKTYNFKNDTTFNSVSVPHGNHYELLTNDKQRQLYDAYYRAMLPQYLGTNTSCNLYKFATVSSDSHFGDLDHKFARQAVKYDNPEKVEFTVCSIGIEYEQNSDGTYDVYAGAVPDENYSNYEAMNAQFESDMDTIVNTVREAGCVDFSTEESTAISLFKLSFFFAPIEPADREKIPAWHNVEYTRAIRYENTGLESSAYGAVHNKVACCVGMSKAYMYLLQKLGFNDVLIEDVAFVTGHAWNLIKIGGDWYSVDVTNTMSEDGTFGFETADCKRDDLFSAITPTATNPKYTGWYIYSLLYPERFTGDPSENPSNSSTESTTTETPSSSGSEGSSSSESSSNSSNAGSTVNPNENGGSASSNSSSSASTDTTSNNNNSGNSNTTQPSKPSSSENSNSSSNAAASTPTPASTPSSNESENASSSASNNASNSTSAQKPAESNESASTKPSSNDTSASTKPADTKKDEKTKETNKVEKDTKKASVTPSTPKSVSTKVSKKAVTVKWKKQTKNTTGYEIQYSTDKKFKKNLKTVTAKKTSTKTTIKKLKAKKTYYIRIRTVCKQNGKKVHSKWSKVQKVKIK